MSNVIRRLSLIVVLTALSVTSAACGGSESANPAVVSGSADVSRLTAIDNVVGTGEIAVTGHELTVHYEGWLYDVNAPEFKGSQFDSTIGGSPFSFTLGTGEVISGWDQGLLGMRVGGNRTLIIPSGLAYGREGNGPIPPNAAVVFDIELVDVD